MKIMEAQIFPQLAKGLTKLCDFFFVLSLDFFNFVSYFVVVVVAAAGLVLCSVGA